MAPGLESEKNLKVFCSNTCKFGGGCPSKVEPTQVLCISKIRGASWTRDTLDLAESARLRWVKELTTTQIAVRLGFGRTAVVLALRKLKGRALWLEKRRLLASLFRQEPLKK